MSGPTRAVVVGASSGLGRCLGVGLARRGVRVALMARRRDRLASAAAEAGEGSVAVECDVTDEASCRKAMDGAAAAMGGIDALVYAPAIGPLARIEQTTADTWAQVFSTNVTGASLATAAVLPHLQASRGRALYLSSVSGTHTPPWPGLGAYLVSKAALERLVEAWQAEHPGLGFTTVVVGECMGGEGESMTEFASGWDQQLAAEVMQTWLARNYMSGALVDVGEVIRTVETVLRSGPSGSIPEVVVTSRPQS